MKRIPVDYLVHSETGRKHKALLSLKSKCELLDFLGGDFFYLTGLESENT